MNKGRLLYILGILVIRSAFAAIPEEIGAPLTVSFPFNKMMLTSQTGFHYFMVHFVEFLFCFMLWKNEHEYKRTFFIMFCISIFSIFEYLLKYDSIYYTFSNGVNLSSHMVMVLILAWSAYKEK